MPGQHRTHRGSARRSGAVVSIGAINRLARLQHGLVTRAQLLELGVPPDVIDYRLKTRRLVRVRRGIYRVGPIPQPLERQMAAILACGADAVLGHRSAADLHELIPYPAGNRDVHVIVTGSDRGPKPDIRIHRTRRLPGDEAMRLNRIPVTTPARTILDLAPELRPAALEQVVAAAHRRRPANTKALHTLIARYPRRPGTPALRRLLQGTPQFTRSKAERRLLEALRKAGFTVETNVRLAGYEADLYLSEHNLVVEVDGEPFHSARPDRKRDYARDAALGELGIRVLRFDADEPVERALAMIARASR